MKKYLVVWVTKHIFLDSNKEECVLMQDHYQAFVDGDDDNFESATNFYEDLLLKDNIYTANVCLVVQSTDY